MRQYYLRMKNRLVQTVVAQWRETGTMWRGYDAVSGEGVGERDVFWSDVVLLLIMGEVY